VGQEFVVSAQTQSASTWQILTLLQPLLVFIVARNAKEGTRVQIGLKEESATTNLARRSKPAKMHGKVAQVMGRRLLGDRGMERVRVVAHGGTVHPAVHMRRA